MKLPFLRYLFSSFLTFPFVDQHFICQQSRLNEMTSFILHMIAFSYSIHVNLYWSDEDFTHS